MRNIANARVIYENNPEILKPISEFFSVDLADRLYNEHFWQGLVYA